jgi:PTH1 family peptidyl-tRNA hydrolase
VKLIVGLGNPGIEYQFTPHNLGFLTVDRLAERCGAEVSNRRSRALTVKATIGSEQVLLAKPETYMNLSGLAVRELLEELGAKPEEDLIVIYDELDLPFGAIRVRQRGGSAGHNGMNSILGVLATEEFTRVRLGVGPDRKPADGARYLLSQFRRSQLKKVDALLDASADAVEMIVREGVVSAMNRFNRRPDKDEAEPSSPS